VRTKVGHHNPMWVDWQVIIGVPHDALVVGYGNDAVNYLRFYSARASDEFDMQIFIRKRLCPRSGSQDRDGNCYQGTLPLRWPLLQAVASPNPGIFMVACALRDTVANSVKTGPSRY
jgi:starch phosphorylase